MAQPMDGMYGAEFENLGGDGSRMLSIQGPARTLITVVDIDHHVGTR
jgi:hypothetical protein